jgi:polyphosphate kinase 2 (PPK2 family)
MKKNNKREKKTGRRDDKLSTKGYEKQMRKLQVELCHLQEWVKATGQRIVVVFEGRDAAGKGGTIKALTERVSRACSGWWRCRASDREKRMYVQRYLPPFRRRARS